MSCFCKKRDTTSGPNVNDTPLSFSDHPVMSLSGSDHSRSQSKPGESGKKKTRVGLNDEPNSLSQCILLACVRNIRRSHDSPYLFHRLQIRTQTTMHCEDLLVDDSSDRETIEAICEGFPQLNVISAFACRNTESQ